MSSPLLVWLATALFAATHSLLAADAVKGRLCTWLGWDAQRYRLAYVLLAVAATAAWIGFVRALPDAPLYALTGAPAWAMRGVQLMGVVVLVASLRAFDVGVFLGLRPPPPGGEGFHRRGLYACVRHPMYLGALLVLWGHPVQTVNHAHFTLAATLYLLLGARLEERRMARAWPAYAHYRRQTPMLWPRLACLRAQWGRRG